MKAEDLPRLATDPPRAALAFATRDGPQCLPVVVRCDHDQIRIGIDRASLPENGAPERAVLLVDDGRYWFELQAIVRRGTLEPTASSGTNAWFRLTTQHEVAWDYGRLHEEPPP